MAAVQYELSHCWRVLRGGPKMRGRESGVYGTEARSGGHDERKEEKEYTGSVQWPPLYK